MDRCCQELLLMESKCCFVLFPIQYHEVSIGSQLIGGQDCHVSCGMQFHACGHSLDAYGCHNIGLPDDRIRKPN
jgi:hypothetical protein